VVQALGLAYPATPSSSSSSADRSVGRDPPEYFCKLVLWLQPILWESSPHFHFGPSRETCRECSRHLAVLAAALTSTAPCGRAVVATVANRAWPGPLAASARSNYRHGHVHGRVSYLAPCRPCPAACSVAYPAAWPGTWHPCRRPCSDLQGPYLHDLDHGLNDRAHHDLGGGRGLQTGHGLGKTGHVLAPIDRDLGQSGREPG